MIKLENLIKTYPTVTAVNNISLKVEKGELFGFLGPNGAGKTTTIKMMAGLVKPTSGSIFINGCNMAHDPNEVKRITGFIPDRPFLYGKLTGR
jgi:ABC-2 type transport system ATP-binding protein